MLETIMKYDIIFYAMGILALWGAIAKMVSYFAIKKVVKSASEIQKSEQRLMRLIKAKFEHASMVSDKVENVEAFVKKYLYEYRVFKVQLNTWRTFPTKIIWLIAVLAGIGAVGSYYEQGFGEMMVQYVGIALAYIAILLGMHIFSDEKTKLNAAKNYMVEYLENVCARRYEKANRIVKEQERECVKEEQEEKEEVTISEETEASRHRAEQEMRIRAILEEFLA